MSRLSDLILCISLGGTKIQLGAITPSGVLAREDEILWRNEFHLPSGDSERETRFFVKALAERVRIFLQARRIDLGAVKMIGVAFPGPRSNQGWQSNNLPAKFRLGVDLERELREAILQNRTSTYVPEIRVIFDAQCDAGGELYHPDGHLFGSIGNGIVLNLATGIAAGLIADGRVLIGDHDFRTSIGPDYDGGAGQLGRHLWYRIEQGDWQYHYRPQGQTPRIAGSARMTDRLSGPALAARLLSRLFSNGLMDARCWHDPDVDWSDILALGVFQAGDDSIADQVEMAQQIRESPRPVATAVHRWTNRQIIGQESSEALREQLFAFSQEIAYDLGAALNAWFRVAQWARFADNIVLTGGVGIGFFAVTDDDFNQGLLACLGSALPNKTKIRRSKLRDAIERECYLFYGQIR